MSSVRSSFDDLTRHFLSAAWWAMLLRGVAAIVFGVLTFAWPGISLLSLVVVYGVYALMDGVFALAAAFKSGSGRGPLILTGVLGLAAGAVALAWPGVTALVLVLIIGWWSILRGVVEIVTAIRLRKTLANEWMLILAGAVSILFGLALVAAPGAGALALLWLIGAWAVVFGVLMVVLAFRLRTLHRG